MPEKVEGPFWQISDTQEVRGTIRRRLTSWERIWKNIASNFDIEWTRPKILSENLVFGPVLILVETWDPGNVTQHAPFKGLSNDIWLGKSSERTAPHGSKYPESGQSLRRLSDLGPN